jgi:hypothetical protein
MAVNLSTHRGIYYLHVEQFFGALCADGSFGYVGTTGVLSGCFGLWFGMEDYRLVVYREVGSIPEELLLGQGRVFSI